MALRNHSLKLLSIQGKTKSPLQMIECDNKMDKIAKVKVILSGTMGHEIEQIDEMDGYKVI